MARIAVLTGDLIASQSLTEAQIGMAMDHLSDVVAQTAHQFELEHWRFSRSSGDGWQAALSSPRYAPRLMLWCRAVLRGSRSNSDTRIALAFGDHEGPLPDDLNSAFSAPFIASGRLLQNMPKHSDFACASDTKIDACLRLMDHVSHGWTAAQAATMDAALRNPGDTRAVIAERLGKSRQAVDQSLKSAGFEPLMAALQLIESQTHD